LQACNRKGHILQVILKSKHHILFAILQGELDHHSTESARNKIDTAITTNLAKHLILDFSQLSFMDSSGIGLAMGRYKTMKAVGGKMTLVADGRIQRMMHLSGLSKYLSIYKTKEEAMAEIEVAK